ncbi:oligoendopeptidase, partial [Lacticaseibacillus saniviri]|nr:oligoendopeptidase [Lacticaseibacillus saniviri]
MSYPINWNTDRIFKDGITGTAIHQRLAEITSAIPTFNAAVNAWQLAADAPAFSNFNALLDQYENIQNGISTIMTFAEMISSAESKNQEAGPVLSQAQNLATQFQSGTNQLQKKLVAATDSDFKQLQQAFPVIAFNLQELREQGKRLLDDATEDLINRLAIDGFNGWSQHYTTLSADLKFPVTLNDGQSLTLSAGQAQNRFESDLDPKNREIVFNQWEQTWSNHAANFADTLNHLAGFRLTDYQAHHEDNYLAVPLRLNRMH